MGGIIPIPCIQPTLIVCVNIWENRESSVTTICVEQYALLAKVCTQSLLWRFDRVCSIVFCVHSVKCAAKQRQDSCTKALLAQRYSSVMECAGEQVT